MEEGTKITSPEAPTYAGFTFDGWYKEAALENKWNFTTDIVKADITLYAKWIPIDENQKDKNNNGNNNGGKDQGTGTTNFKKTGFSINLPKTGNKTILGSGILLLLGGSAIVIGGLTVLKKRRDYNK